MLGFAASLFLYMYMDSRQPKIMPSTKLVTPTLIPAPSPYPFSEDKLWSLVNDWQTSQGWKPYIKDQRLCDLADIRLEETSKDWSHNGFFAHSKDFVNINLGENLARDYITEETTLKAWLKSPSHKKNLTSPYTYSCIQCEGDRCVQLFGNF